MSLCSWPVTTQNFLHS